MLIFFCSLFQIGGESENVYKLMVIVETDKRYAFQEKFYYHHVRELTPLEH